MKIFKFFVIFFCVTCAVSFVAAAIMIIKQNMADISMNDGIGFMIKDEKYKNPVKTEIKNIPEINTNKKNIALTSGSLYNEIKNQFPEYKIIYYKNIKNSELIDKIYDSLSDNIPAVCLYCVNNEINYCVITGIDIPENKITAVNPSGYIETHTVQDFLNATRFENYKNMDFYLKLGFAVEIFAKNTVYIIEKPE